MSPPAFTCAALAASALLLAACAPPPAAPEPAPRAPAPPRPPPAPAAQVFTPPPERCRRDDPAPLPSPAGADAAPLDVRATPAGVSLEARGAAAGRVIVALAALAKRTARVHGSGAGVRIYAHVAAQPADTLIDAVARAASLVRWQGRDDVLAFVDPAEAVQLERDRRASQEDSAPIQTRIVPARHPAEAARVLAQLLLGCRGVVVAAPRSGQILLHESSARIARAEGLLLALDAAPAAPIALDEDAPPGPVTRGVPEPVVPPCDAIAAAPPPLFPGGPLTADGAAAGDVLRHLARARGEDIVVGCGGDRPAFFHAAAPMPPRDVAPLLGLSPLDRMTYTSEAVAHALAYLSVVRGAPRERYLVRSFATPHAEDLAVAAATMLRPRAVTAAYPPASLLLVGGSAHDIAMVSRLVEAWDAAPPAAARRGAGKPGLTAPPRR